MSLCVSLCFHLLAVLSPVSGVLQENEKLYMQLKEQKTTSKANEGAMFSENQRLLSELALTKWVFDSGPDNRLEFIHHVSLFIMNRLLYFSQIIPKTQNFERISV